MSTATADVWDAIDNPQVRAGVSDYYGQVKVDTFFCVLVKGTGKVPFDPQKHSADQRRTSIEIAMFPLPEMNISYDVSRNMLAKSREWAGIVLPSIKNLGISAQGLNNQWVHLRTKSTGSTYTNKNGETRERTTFEFVALFQDEATCRAAYNSAAADGPAPVQQPAPAAAPPNGNGNGAGSQKEKDAALKFLKVIVENAARGQTDLGIIQATVAANIANMAPIAKFFTGDSPETMQLIMEAMAK